jgi:hypothetical protein
MILALRAFRGIALAAYFLLTAASFVFPILCIPLLPLWLISICRMHMRNRDVAGAAARAQAWEAQQEQERAREAAYFEGQRRAERLRQVTRDFGQPSPTGPHSRVCALIAGLALLGILTGSPARAADLGGLGGVSDAALLPAATEALARSWPNLAAGWTACLGASSPTCSRVRHRYETALRWEISSDCGIFAVPLPDELRGEPSR